MIALHGVLLEHAERLRLSGAELNYEADLRRSASAAYYALLHILVYDTVHFLFPDQTQEAEESRCVTSRRFDHKTTQQFAKSIKFHPAIYIWLLCRTDSVSKTTTRLSDSLKE